MADYAYPNMPALVQFPDPQSHNAQSISVAISGPLDSKVESPSHATYDGAVWFTPDVGGIYTLVASYLNSYGKPVSTDTKTLVVATKLTYPLPSMNGLGSPAKVVIFVADGVVIGSPAHEKEAATPRVDVSATDLRTKYAARSSGVASAVASLIGKNASQVKAAMSSISTAWTSAFDDSNPSFSGEDSTVAALMNSGWSKA